MTIEQELISRYKAGFFQEHGQVNIINQNGIGNMKF